MTDAERERAAVVAYLRKKADEDIMWQIDVALSRAADAIERGEHLRGGE